MGLAEQIRLARHDGVTIIPVVDDLTGFSLQVPDLLSSFNGIEWSGSSPASRLASAVLEELSIVDRDRRVFVSHRRSDGLAAAEQLHDALSHVRFKPFIDRFAIPPGDDVQRCIADALEDFAFLLVLETPDAHLSDWVFDEVDYALAHAMGLLIVTWPGNPKPIPGSLGVPRLVLETADLVRDEHNYEVLTAEALDRAISEAEAAHARGLVRRRRMLLRSVQEAAESHGGSCTALRDWVIDVASPLGHSVVAVAPRIPASEDLHRLDQARAQVDPSARALLVHAARRLDDSRRRHLEWVNGDRSLQMLPENAIGGAW